MFGIFRGSRPSNNAIPSKNLTNYSKEIAAIVLTLLMLLTPASAFISNWNGPSSVSGTSQSISDAWQVPGNSTVLDAWLHINEDGMTSNGNGTTWAAADVPGNMSVGQFSGSVLDHFDDSLSLSPNGSFSSVDGFTNSSYQFALNWSNSGSLWKVDGLTGINGTVVGNSRTVPHGQIPAAPHGGGISAGTLPGFGIPSGSSGYLETPSILLPALINNFSFSFWHWYHLDTPANGTGDGDGAWLEIKLDNGNWTWIEPQGGYDNTIDPNISSPSGAPTNGTHGFPVFANTHSSGWQFANYSLDNLSGINNASNIQFRFQVATLATSTPRPGWFLDDMELTNEGNSSGMWHHGCSAPTAATCSYSNNADGILEFTTIDLSNATGTVTASFSAQWDLEGSSYDNWWLEASSDNTTWTDITSNSVTYSAVGGGNGVPTGGIVIGGTTYMDDSNGWHSFDFDLPTGYAGDNTTWVRFRVETDSSVQYGTPQDNFEGLIVDNLVVQSNNSTYYSNDFNSANSATHSGLNGNADDWSFIVAGIGYMSFTYGFEDSQSLPPGGWNIANAGTTGWEFGTQILVGPSSWPSAPSGFGTDLSGSYPSSAWDHLYSPTYTIPIGVNARLVFDHWICAEPGWDGGAVFYSLNNGSWTHFDSFDSNGTSWYDGLITTSSSPLFNIGSFDGSSATSGSCSSTGSTRGWESEEASLSNFSGNDIRFRFSMASDSIIEYDGWYIDDVGVEVDYFDPVGDWISPLIPADEHGYGFVDASIATPNGTWAGITILDANSQPVSGWDNLSLPVDLSGIDVDALGGGLHVKLNIGTSDPYVSPLVYGLSVGANRVFTPHGYPSNAWAVDSFLTVNGTGVLENSGGVTQSITSSFIGSAVPINGAQLDGSFSGATFSLIDSTGSNFGQTLTTSGNINLPSPSHGYGVHVTIQPSGWIEWFSFTGNFVQPSLDAQIDVASEGTIDWEFTSSPNYGALGWQDHIAGTGHANSADSHSEIINISGGTGVASTTVLLPADAILHEGYFALTPGASSEIVSVDVAGITAISLSQGWAGTQGTYLSSTALSAIGNLPASHQDTYGRDWVEIEFNFSGVDQELTLSAVALSYGLFENVSGLGPVVKAYHEANNNNGLEVSVDIPLSWTATRGGIGISGGVSHEMMITNEPFTPPTTFYPDGNDAQIITGHHHLTDNALITDVHLTGTASNGDQILLQVTDLSSGGTFSQLDTNGMLALDLSASSATIVAGSWIVDWVLSTPWSWDDESQIDWSAQAFDSSGYGLSPAFGVSGGSGSQASENDLEIDSMEIRDGFGRELSNIWNPSYPFFAQSETLVDVFGSVRFQNTPSTRPQIDAFLVSVNVDGTETSMVSEENGTWTGQVLLPAGSGVAEITASIARVGPIVGPIGATDVTTPMTPYEVKLDNNSPEVRSLEVDTPQGMKPANGYTWDPINPIVFSLTIFDAEALGDEVSLNYWREGSEDTNSNGLPDADEYLNFTESLPAGTVGERQLTFPSLDVSNNVVNGNVSVYISGQDWSGISYENGGSSGYDSDYATLVTATNTPTTMLINELSLELTNEYLLAGQQTGLSFVLADDNGIQTLDHITVHLRGESETLSGVIEIDPRDGSISTPAGSYLTDIGLEVTLLDASQARFDVSFRVVWDAPASWDSGWSIPAILVFDDDLQNPVSSSTNLAQIRWELDRDLVLQFDDVVDQTPPISSPLEDGRLFVAPGDELEVTGHLSYVKSGAQMIDVPQGMSTTISFDYGSQEIEASTEIEDDGSFVKGLVLPFRQLSDPSLILHLELFGLPGTAQGIADDTASVIVDWASPEVSFEALSTMIDSIELQNMLITASISDDGGMSDENITLNWEYRRDGILLPNSEGSASIVLLQNIGTIWTYQNIVDLSPAILLETDDRLMIWVEGKDMAGNDILGSGSLSDPLGLQIIVREFVLTVPSIQIALADGTPPAGNQIYAGEELSFIVTLRNAGNLAGVVNVTLAETIDGGVTWIEHDTIEMSIPEGQTRELIPFFFETHTSGTQSLYLNITGAIDGFSDLPSTPGCAHFGDSVQCDLREEGDMPTVLNADLKDDGESMVWVILLGLLILVLITAVFIIVLRKGEDDLYAYDDKWSDYSDEQEVVNTFQANVDSLNPNSPSTEPPGLPPAAQPASVESAAALLVPSDDVAEIAPTSNETETLPLPTTETSVTEPTSETAPVASAETDNSTIQEEE